MPEDRIPISEFSYTNNLNNGDQLPIIQADGQEWDNYRTALSDIGHHVNQVQQYTIDLHTTSDTIIGAINELADGGASRSIIGTASGSIATFADGGDNIPLKSCEVAIVAQQASGTPTPSSPLPITGFSSVALSVSDGVTPTTTNVSLGQTIYGGTAELVGGNGIKTFGYVDLGDLTWTMGSSQIGFYANLPDAISPISSGDINAICSCYERTDSPSTTAGLPNLTFCLSDGNLTTQKRVFIRDDSYNGDANAFKTGVTGQKLVYTLETPTAFTFTGANIPTLSGVNNIYANSGDVDLEYFTEDADEIAELIRVMT